MNLIDTHCHLNDPAFRKDLGEVLARARRGGVSRLVVVGYDLPSSQAAVKLTYQYSEIFAAVGVHPHDARLVTEEVYAAIEGLLDEEKVVALGEIGLDYHYDNSPRDIQQDVFRRFLKLARQKNKPVVIHDREAHQDILRILHEESATYQGVMHCYSGSAEMLKDFLSLGFYISLAGPVTFKNAKKLPEVVRALPINRLLLETDSPYLAPHPYRGRRNEPLYLREVAYRVAELKNMPVEELAERTWSNAGNCFGLPEKA